MQKGTITPHAHSSTAGDGGGLGSAATLMDTNLLYALIGLFGMGGRGDGV